MAPFKKSADANKADNREPFAAFLGDEESLKAVRPIAEEYGWPVKRVQKGSLESAIRALGIMEPPRLLMVDVSAAKDPSEEVETLIDTVGTDTAVIAVGQTNDVGYYRKLVGAGVQEYLLKPLSKDAVSAAISKAYLSSHAPKGKEGERAPNKMAVVIGIRGGVGASLVATNCAWITAKEIHRSCALLDLDLHFGTSALTFDLEPGRGLADALEDPSRIDELFIERAMVTVTENLSILGCEMPFDEAFLPDPMALGQLASTLQNKVSYVFVDLPRFLAGHNAHLLEEANDVLVVTEQTLAATRDTIRLLAFLKDVAPKTKVSVVINNCRGMVGDEVSMKDFETSIERKVDYILPPDPKTVLAAVKKGKVLPQVSRDSKLVKTLREISQELTGLKTKKQPKAKWLSLGK